MFNFISLNISALLGWINLLIQIPFIKLFLNSSAIKGSQIDAYMWLFLYSIFFAVLCMLISVVLYLIEYINKTSTINNVRYYVPEKVTNNIFYRFIFILGLLGYLMPLLTLLVI